MTGRIVEIQGSGPPSVVVTVAEEVVFHYISDEELELLGREESEPMMQLFWTCIGVVLGSLQGAYLGAHGWWVKGTIHMDDAIPLFLMAICIPMAGVSFYAAWHRRKRIRSLQERIRSRHRAPAATGVVLDYAEE